MNAFNFECMKISDLIANSLRERTKLIQLFSFIVMGCVALITLRFFLNTDRTFLFLLWNFFLALIPLLLSSILLQMNKGGYSTFSMIGVGIAWMLFFPNAPYILTDFIHIAYGEPYWMPLDILTISWFSISALLAALISMNDISNILLSRYHQKRVSIMILGLSMLAGFGIYLGRYLRFNSWDVLQRPNVLFMRVSERIVDPFSHPRTWLTTLGFGMLLYVVYLGVKAIGKEMAVVKNTEVD